MKDNRDIRRQVTTYRTCLFTFTESPSPDRHGIRTVPQVLRVRESDAGLICSHFDGSVKAYLDWICALKSARHRGVAQGLRFYCSLERAKLQDEGVWIDC